MFAKSNLEWVKLFPHACNLQQVTAQDSSWPIVLIIQTSDGIYGTHAVTTWKGMIFDSNCPSALRWSQTSLDWCSGANSSCIGFSRAYHVCPANFGKALPMSDISIGMQVRSHTFSLGWIMRLPTKKMKGYHVRLTNGRTETMSDEDLAKFVVPSNDYYQF